MDSAILRLNHYPADKYYENQLRHPVDSNLSSELRYPPFEHMGPGRLDRSSYQLLLSTPKFNLKTYGAVLLLLHSLSGMHFHSSLDLVIPFLLLNLSLR